MEQTYYIEQYRHIYSKETNFNFGVCQPHLKLLKEYIQYTQEHNMITVAYFRIKLKK